MPGFRAVFGVDVVHQPQLPVDVFESGEDLLAAMLERS
jgi:hypothetical protein